MNEEKKTETEQLVDELTGKNQEEPEEPSEKPDEPTEEVEAQSEDEEQAEEDEILSEEELEVEREIESYATKSKELDAKLAEFKAKELLELRRDAMFQKDYTEDQVERYVKHIQGETAEEINRSVWDLMREIPPRVEYADPSLMNGAKQKPKVDTQSRLEEMGKAAFERVKHKVFPFMGRR